MRGKKSFQFLLSTPNLGLNFINWNFIDGFLHKFRYSGRKKKSCFLTIQCPFKHLIEVETDIIKFLNYIYEVLTLKRRL